MLGQPYSMVLPEVIGFQVGAAEGRPSRRPTRAHVTQMLRKRAWSESSWSSSDPALTIYRSRIARRSATWPPNTRDLRPFFPVDDDTITFLTITARKATVSRW